ncbi:hypothetical protein BDZ89DRAFT_1070671 [Hymenopellis radicata]|nr:hypothetical protein BDZ89DRAFT_1070671 [Hymenopellis radicata]
MTLLPSSPGTAQEEWTDADFDLPDGQAIHTPSEKDEDDDEDWDIELDLGNTGGAKIQALPRSDPSFISSEPKMNIFRPPSTSSLETTDDDDEDEEGLSTIKMPLKPVVAIDRPQSPIDEDFEEGFSLPSDLTRLSLAPLSLNHRGSKQSLEWEDKDHTTSSQSSDAYSTLGFAHASPSSNSSASISNVETEDECEDDMDGLVIPSSIFDSGHGVQHLSHLLALKKAAVDTPPSSSATTEDDFEMGLSQTQQPRLRRVTSRSTSVPAQRQASTSLRPPSRVKSDRAKSPINPPQASAHQLQKLKHSPSPPLRPPPPGRSQTFQAFPSPGPAPSSFLFPKPGSLRGQKSHSGLQPMTSSSSKRLTRKASLSSLMEPPPEGSASGSGRARYDQPTAASRAKTQRKPSTTRLSQDYESPVRSSTPSSNSNSPRTTTMPAAGRFKIRAALSSVFRESPTSRTASPVPPRPPSNLSKAPRATAISPTPVVPKVLRKPKRVRTYGDGTELDAIDDLPTDRDKESRFRVQPAGYGNRIPGGSYAAKAAEKPPVRKTTRREGSDSSAASLQPSLRRASKMDLSCVKITASPPKKRKVATTSPTQAKRRPTLIRNLGSASAPKVVGDMKWNPQTLRWEGNDQVLKEFDAVVTSTRPALITHLSGSSMGSPVLSLAAGARRVGNMIFDPARMCWISALPPDEEEPDVFANLADDEEDGDGWETKGGTIRATIQLGNTSMASSNTTASSMDSPESIRSHTRTPSDAGSDRGSRASLICSNVDEAFVARCRVAENRHREDMNGWVHALAVRPPSDASFLYEIRALATRKY